MRERIIVARTLIFRLVAIVLLTIAAAEVSACDISDSCLTFGQYGSSNDCDQPTGDNCMCCCHHIVPPVLSLTLQAGDVVDEQTPPEPVTHTLTRASRIDHPPQL
jgi:hypothetical protein